MKEKISVSIERETVELIEESVKKGSFRNKSHVVEFSLNKLLKENNDGI